MRFSYVKQIFKESLLFNGEGVTQILLYFHFSSPYRRRICQIILTAFIHTGGASVTGTFLLTLERYLSVKHPSFSKQFLTRQKVKKTIIFTWIFWALYSGLGLAVSWNQQQSTSYSSSKICTLGAEYHNDHHLMSIVVLFFMHQIPMWYLQLKTLKVAKFYMIPAADRLKKRGSVNSVLKQDNEDKSTSKESETEEIRLSNLTFFDHRNGLSVAEVLLERSHNTDGHRRHSAPLPNRESIKIWAIFKFTNE